MTGGGRDSLRPGHERGPVAGTTLRASWLGRSLDRGWPDPVGWRTPAVDGVVEALIGQDRSIDRLEHAVRTLAWERASDTLYLDAALDDLDALWAALGSTGNEPVPPRQARRWLVDAWVDALAVDRGVPCVDPLSGLHTPGYLLGRIHELDRLAAEPTPLVLLAMRWCKPTGPWVRIAMIVSAAAILKEQVRVEATFAQDGAHTALALVPDDLRARVERAGLAAKCLDVPIRHAKARVELIGLPEDRELVPGVLRRLRLPPMRAECRISADRQDAPRVVD